LAILYYSNKAEARLDKSDIPKYYFDVKKETEKQRKGQTAYTPAISLIIALNESLKLILNEGLPELAKRHDIMALATREAVKELGLKLLSENPSNSATGVYAPKGINADDLRKELLKIGFRVAGGQDSLKGKVFRIAHMGYFDFMDVVQVISGLEIALNKMGFNVPYGKGTSKAMEIVAEYI